MAAASRKNQFKVVLLGEGCVGKTSLMLRYVQDKFNDKHLTTLQVRYLDFMVVMCGYNLIFYVTKYVLVAQRLNRSVVRMCENL